MDAVKATPAQNEPRRIHRKKWVRLGFVVYVAADTEVNAQHMAQRMQKALRKMCKSNKLSFGNLPNTTSAS